MTLTVEDVLGSLESRIASTQDSQEYWKPWSENYIFRLHWTDIRIKGSIEQVIVKWHHHQLKTKTINFLNQQIKKLPTGLELERAVDVLISDLSDTRNEFYFYRIPDWNTL